MTLPDWRRDGPTAYRRDDDARIVAVSLSPCLWVAYLPGSKPLTGPEGWVRRFKTRAAAQRALAGAKAGG